MALWFVVVFILLSASLVLYLAVGPLRKAPNAFMLCGLAALQYVAALLLVGARLLGKA